jgi:hypothetical protein
VPELLIYLQHSIPQDDRLHYSPDPDGILLLAAPRRWIVPAFRTEDKAAVYRKRSVPPQPRLPVFRSPGPVRPRRWRGSAREADPWGSAPAAGCAARGPEPARHEDHRVVHISEKAVTTSSTGGRRRPASSSSCRRSCGSSFRRRSVGEGDGVGRSKPVPITGGTAPVVIHVRMARERARGDGVGDVRGEDLGIGRTTEAGGSPPKPWSMTSWPTGGHEEQLQAIIGIWGSQER